MSGPVLIDCHSDIMIDVHRRRAQGEHRVLERIHLPRLREGRVSASVCTVGGDSTALCPYGLERAYQSALALLKALRDDVAESDGGIAVAGSSDEVRELVAAGTFAIIPALEGAMALEGELDRLAEFRELGVRSIGLTWNRRNELATGLGAGEGGLTDVGRAAINAMNGLGIVVDVSHASAQTFQDVIDASSSPIIASHANARSLCDHPRNLDDGQLAAIAAGGGLVGVVLYPGFVGPLPVAIGDVLDHVEYLAARIGTASVAIGADFIDYALEEMSAELTSSGVPYREEEFVFPHGLEDCRFLGNLLDGMEERGFGAADIAKISGENFLRVMAEVEAGAVN